MRVLLASAREHLLDMGAWLIVDAGCARMTMRDFLVFGPGSILEQQSSGGNPPESLASPDRCDVSIT